MTAALAINGHDFVWGRQTYIMGILNITPDSFSGDGLRLAADPVAAARAQAEAFIAAGAHILDIGGESTRPGAQNISAAQELERVIPVIQALAGLDIPLSIDTYKASVAAAALDAGAHIVNDVWGLRADPHMPAVVAAHAAPVILMHNRSKPKDAAIQAHLGGRYVGVEYDDLIADIKRELLGSVALAHAAGIPDARIILDPGIGFGKTVEQNLQLLDQVAEFKTLGYPLLVGPSRKSFIGYTLDLPPGQRAEGTAAAVSVAITRGADIVRVHDVALIASIAKITDAITRANHD
jgi:dihydropteroate synthase